MKPQFLAGFGLGALNDAEEDDLDVYDRGFNIGNTKLAYEGTVDDDERILLASNRDKSSSSNLARDKTVSVYNFLGGYS